MLQEAQSILLANIRNKYKLYLLDYVAKKYQEEFSYNISQYIRSIQNSSIEISTSRSDIDKFLYRYEYALKNLGVKLNSQDKESILGAIKSKYLSIVPEEKKQYASFYLSRPSQEIWSIYSSSKNSGLLSTIMQDEVEDLFIDFILEKIAEA